MYNKLLHTHTNIQSYISNITFALARLEAANCYDENSYYYEYNNSSNSSSNDDFYTAATVIITVNSD